MLKPGTFARVHIETGRVDQVLTLPYAALQYRYGVNRVFVVDGDKLDGARVEGGRSRSAIASRFSSGVKPGDPSPSTDVENWSTA